MLKMTDLVYKEDWGLLKIARIDEDSQEIQLVNGSYIKIKDLKEVYRQKLNGDYERVEINWKKRIE